jgi:hypothetical protein
VEPIFLKVKIMSLAAEARIIRHEERRAWDNHAARKRLRSSNAPCRHKVGDRILYLELKAHRRGVVRDEARASLLAYGFLRGRAYRQLERKTHDEWDVVGAKTRWEKVAGMVTRFGKVPKDDAVTRLKAWREVVGPRG